MLQNAIFFTQVNLFGELLKKQTNMLLDIEQVINKQKEDHSEAIRNILLSFYGVRNRTRRSNNAELMKLKSEITQLDNILMLVCQNKSELQKKISLFEELDRSHITRDNFFLLDDGIQSINQCNTRFIQKLHEFEIADKLLSCIAEEKRDTSSQDELLSIITGELQPLIEKLETNANNKSFRYVEAAQCSCELLKTIRNNVQELTDGTLTPAEFHTNCTKAVEMARPVLASHRGLKFFQPVFAIISIIMVSVACLFLLPLTLAALVTLALVEPEKFSKDRASTFFQPKTATEEVIDAVFTASNQPTS
jgi:hypothetical protein